MNHQPLLIFIFVIVIIIIINTIHIVIIHNLIDIVNSRIAIRTNIRYRYADGASGRARSAPGELLVLFGYIRSS